jgi:hypothetical protein
MHAARRWKVLKNVAGGRRVLRAVGAAALLSGSLVSLSANTASAQSIQADNPAGTVFSTQGCTPWSVPDGVDGVEIQATGAAGGNTGGLGDEDSATLTGLNTGDGLYVCVDVGGGSGLFSGGGASGVSLGPDFSQPVVIGGGGGAATYHAGGGNAGTPVASSGGQGCTYTCSGGGGGGDNTLGQGGAGGGSTDCGVGSGANGSGTTAAGPGSGGVGDSAGDCGGSSSGGSGGAGYYGGGGGGDGPYGSGGGGGTDYCAGGSLGATTVSNCVVSSGAGFNSTAGTAAGDAKVVFNYISATGNSPQPITFETPESLTYNYGASPFVLSAQGGGSGNPITFAVDANSTGVCSVSPSANNQTTVTVLAAGSCQIDADQASAAGFDEGTGSETFTINQVGLSITAGSYTIAQGSPLPTIVPSYGGFVNGDTSASLTTPPTCGTDADPTTPGVYATTCSDAVDPNYIISYNQGTLSVLGNSIDLTCPTFGDLQTAVANYKDVTIECPTADTIQFGSISLTHDETIDAGASPGTITFNGGSEQLSNSGYSLTVNGVTLTGACNSIYGNGGTVTLTDSTLSGNSCHALYDSGSSEVNVDHSTFSENDAGSAQGGDAIFVQFNGSAASLTVQNSTFTNNGSTQCCVRGGAISDGGPGFNATVTLTGDTFTGNQVGPSERGGAVALQGNTTDNFTNDTFTGNTAGTGALGSAIYDCDGSATIASSTIAGNSAATAGNGALYACGMTVESTIIANNSGGNCQSGVVDGGYNLVDDSTCGFTNGTNGDIVGQNPLLGLLANNGGPTQTMALSPGSPAIDAVSDASDICPTADQRGYSRTTTDGSCDIGAFEYQDPQAISFTGPTQTTYTYGDKSFTVSADGGNSGNPVTFSVDSSSTGVCGSGGTNGVTITITGAGTCTVDADQATGNGYAAAPQVSQSFTVNPANPQLNWNQPSDITYGSALSSTQLDAQSDVAGSFSYTPGLREVLNAGLDQTLSATFTPTDATDYVSGGTVQTTINVDAATISVTASNQSMTYGGSVPSVGYAYSGFVNHDTSSVVTGTPSCDTAATSQSPVGSYDTSCDVSGLSAANYIFSGVDGSLAVNQAHLKITANDQSANYGGTLPAFTFSTSGFVNGDMASSLTTQPTCSASAHSSAGRDASPVGQYAIACSGAVDGNYSITDAGGTLTVNPVPLTITATNESVNYGTEVPALTSTGSGFVNGDSMTSLTTQPTCTTTASSANGKDISPAGAYSVSCSGAGDGNYSPITYTSGTLTVTPSPVVETYTGPTLLTADTNLKMSMKLTSPAGAPIAGRKVTLTLGIHPRIVQSCTATTDASGAASCTIKDIPYYKGHRIITMAFAGDPHGAHYDYKAGQTMVKVLMKSQSG